jgi:hypothetical protein
MKPLAVLAGLLIATAAHGQPRMTVTATVTPKGKGVWVVSGIVSGGPVSLENVMVYARYDGQQVTNGGFVPGVGYVEGTRVGGVWTGAGVAADGTFRIEFTTPATGFQLDLYTTTGGTVYPPNLPGRAAVPVP